MDAPADETLLPPEFRAWFAARGWRPRTHQLALIEEARAGRSCLLIAPTGGGKTLAGFLPSLIDLAAGGHEGLHTLYVSPLKALAVDVARNLESPAREMALPIAIETRTGDTPPGKRRRQSERPPQILLTTPEQVTLLAASPQAPRLFGGLRAIVLDELHALVHSKRGDLLALALARLGRLAPQARRVGLSATVKDAGPLRRYLAVQPMTGEAKAALITTPPGPRPELSVLASEAHIPWATHSARHAMPEVLNAIRAARTALVFVNTRAQAELIFQELWRLNAENLAIALHHGSLAPEQRRKVEAAMAEGRLRAVVCTSTLDLGIDWGAVDLVIQVGAPKGASRLVQRVGRANHRLDAPSRALMVPANRFEVLECVAAREAVAEGKLDAEPAREGALDVLAQHVVGMACAGPFDAETLFSEVRSASPYAGLPRETFECVLAFAATGGYALRAYERFARLRRTADGLWRIANPQTARRWRMNIGTIVEEPMVRVRLASGRGAALRGGRVLGELEEYFIEQLRPGDTFLFAGEILRFVSLQETDALVQRARGAEAPAIPSYVGGKFPLSTFLAERVRAMIAAPESWDRLPEPVAEWLRLQRAKSLLPKPGQLLVETFPRAAKHYLVCYPFEGRLAHQTLGMLLTRRMERARLRPMGFVANEYALAVWSLSDAGRADLAALFDEDMLGDDLEAWLLESALLKRTFRNCAIIAGLIERRHPGAEKSGRQVTFSSDLIYDVLRAHEPDHILLQAARADAATGLLDIARLGAMLARVRGRLVHRRLTRVSPLAVPVMLEIGKVPIHGDANEALLAEAADALVEEAMAEGLGGDG